VFIETRFQEPQLWVDCSLPETVVEPLLPPHATPVPPGPAAAARPASAADAAAEPPPHPPVASREAHLARGWTSGDGPGGAAGAGGANGFSSLDAAALRQRVEARAPSSDSWRGFSVSMPFLPGGESLNPRATGAAAAAAAEAAGGGWLVQLDRPDGRPPGRAAAPGLPRGAFGAWALPEAEAALCEWRRVGWGVWVGGHGCRAGGSIKQLMPPSPSYSLPAHTAHSSHPAHLPAPGDAAPAPPRAPAPSATPAAPPPSAVPAPAPKLAGPSAAAKAARAQSAAIFQGLWMLGAEAEAESEAESEADSEAAASEAEAAAEAPAPGAAAAAASAFAVAAGEDAPAGDGAAAEGGEGEGLDTLLSASGTAAAAAAVSALAVLGAVTAVLWPPALQVAWRFACPPGSHLRFVPTPSSPLTPPPGRRPRARRSRRAAQAPPR
jgi:hypothetical protein